MSIKEVWSVMKKRMLLISTPIILIGLHVNQRAMEKSSAKDNSAAIRIGGGIGDKSIINGSFFSAGRGRRIRRRINTHPTINPLLLL
jgi:hypothetical protein